MSVSSAATPPLESSNRGPYQATSVYSVHTSISKLDPEHQEHVIGAELQKLLDHVTVLSPHDLLSLAFPDKKWEKKASPAIKLSFKKQLGHRKLQFSEKDPNVYREFKAAFNTCCAKIAPDDDAGDYTPKGKLTCIDIHALRPETEDLSGDPTRRAPDLCLSFDTKDDYSPEKFYSSGILAIELKADINADPRFTARASPGSSTKQDQPVQPPTTVATVHPPTITSPKIVEKPITAAKVPKPFSNAAAGLLLQAFGYVSAQWSELPYRFVWSITITGEILRIWRWSSSGVLVTEAIDYMNDATPVYHFIQAIGKGPYSRFGLDIGRGMTFSGVEKRKRDQVNTIVDCYLEATSQTDLQVKWSKRARRGDIWSFEQISSVPVYPKAVEGSDLTEENRSLPTKDSVTEPSCFYVLSYPIWRGKGVYSRGTRCYLAVSRSTFENWKKITVGDLRMLKTSWQTAGDSQESDFFECVQAVHGERVPHLASMLAAGRLESTLQDGGRPHTTTPTRGGTEKDEAASPERGATSTKSHDPIALQEKEEPQAGTDAGNSGPEMMVDPEGRHLQWIVFKQVGERISGFRSEKELLQVVLDAIQAHEHLHNAGILHGDISENNVLIELGTDKESGSTRRGLLIDLDMARFVTRDQHFPDGSYLKGTQHATHPKITGTLLFMSAAMTAVPPHHCWHDLESFYWLLLFITLRHVQGLTLFMPDQLNHQDSAPLDLDDPKNRTTILSKVFPSLSHGDDVLATFCRAKEAFIKEDHDLLASNIPFAVAMLKLTRKLKVQYTLMRKMQGHMSFLESYTTALKLPAMNLPFRAVFTAHTAQDLMAQIKPMKHAGDAINAAFEKLEHSKRTLAEPMQPLGDDTTPSGQETSQGIEEAREFIKGRDLDQYSYLKLWTMLPHMRREMEDLEKGFQDLNGFPNHHYFKQALEAAIKEQDGFPSHPAAPYQGKKRELAPNKLRDRVSRLTLSESGHISYTMGARGAGSSVSEGISSDGAKRKRSGDQGGSESRGKRQKKTHHKAGSSQATRLHNLVEDKSLHDDDSV